MKKRIPNLLSALRIIGSFAMLFVPALSRGFWTLYIFCGLSDMTDGFLARLWQVQSETGRRLDSAADVAFVVFAMAKLWNCFDFTWYVKLWAAVLAVLKIGTYLIIRQKGHMFDTHTILNKLTGFLLFVSPPLLQYKAVQIALCAAATAAWGDEIRHIKSFESRSADTKISEHF